MTKTKPKGFCWPPDLFDLYEAKAAQMRAANPKSRESVSSLQEKALYAYAEAQGWLTKSASVGWNGCKECDDPEPHGHTDDF